MLVPISGAAAAGIVIDGLDPGLTTIGHAVEPVIVTGDADVATRVSEVGGHVTAALDFVGGVVALVPADKLRALASRPGVRAVTANRRAHFSDLTFDDSTTASQFARSTQATQEWAAGNIGAGIGVAVLDTGVSPMPDLRDHLVHGPDLSGEGSIVDSYGHGTVMAGLIAGNGHDSETRTNGAYTGVAPGAEVVAVKVAGANGVVDVSTILQAMHWIDAYRTQFNIRVLNLSWGVDSTQSPVLDPLNYAVERLWGDGIVVVVAAGNEGPSYGTITKPGDDPVVITVGALNAKGDANPNNDAIPDWSSRGPTAAGFAKPDVVAPGRTIVAQRSFGSTVEQNNSLGWVAPSYIKGSGTSQATAVTAGVVALMLGARPELTPDQVKQMLMESADPINNTSRYLQGAGRVQLEAALASTPTDIPQARPAMGLGLLEASRGGLDVVTDCLGLLGVVLSGEQDVRCQPWDPQAWTSSAWTGDAWTGVSWKGAAWDGVSWKDTGWSDAEWDGVSWKGGTWTSDSWQSAAWTGSNDANSPWTGVSWKGATWDGVSWKDAFWTSGDGDQFQTAWWGNEPPPGKHVAGEKYTSLLDWLLGLG
ncbi:MAG TPA: S8 family peptidase [Acidimicrobiia bacterium]|jgi:serine protease AprX|nr:S8 family peptidase [Acidimicrobiia bacterium]